jgi:amino acid adenylation domain-containing protein
VRGVAPFEKGEIEQAVGGRFEKMARSHAGRPAVRDAGRVWTYAEINALANRFAQRLLSSPARPEAPVALLLRPGAPLFAAMLGTLKAGRFYVPLDPALPPARLAAVLGTLEAAVLLSEEASHPLARTLAPQSVPIFSAEAISAEGPAENPAVAVSPDALAYVLFTSGSTGAPKGVMHSHRSLLHNVAKLSNGLQIGPDDRLTLLSSPSFGASVSDIFGALLNGASVCPFSVRGGGLRELAGFLARERVTVYHSVPSAFRALAASLGEGADLSSLRIVKLGGEPVLASDFDLFRRRFPRGCLFHVGLGSTEVHVIRQWFGDHDTPWPGTAPLGYAVEGTDVVLLDEDGREQREAGEIAVVSQILPVGYWRDPERSAATFPPAAGRDGARIYCTGDLGRLLPDGCLLYAGRKDSRLKVRGYRVEVEEVEAALAAVPGVREAAAAGREGPDGTRLVAYVVGAVGAGPGVTTLRRALAATLPDPMVPSAFVFLDRLPRTENGKVDRGALPAPGSARPDLEAEYIEPRDETVRLVAGTFAEVLVLDRVGADDDFFDLGGSSLSAIGMLARLRERTGCDLSAIDLLEAPTPAALAVRLRAGRALPEGTRVCLQRGTGSRSVFVLPGGAGDGADLLVSASLARHVGPEFTFLGLRSGSAPARSLDALTEWCVREIRAVQPRGPYDLVGECVGGILAFHVATRLRREGERIGSLALLDSPFPTWRRRVLHALRPLRAPWGDNLLRRARHHWGVLCQLAPAWRRAYVAEKARVVAAALSRSRREERRPVLVRRAAYVRLLLSAAPGRFDGLVRVVESEEGHRGGFAAAWSKHAARVEVVRVPGDHGTYLAEHVARFAAALRSGLIPSPSLSE